VEAYTSWCEWLTPPCNGVIIEGADDDGDEMEAKSDEEDLAAGEVPVVMLDDVLRARKGQGEEMEQTDEDEGEGRGDEDEPQGEHS